MPPAGFVSLSHDANETAAGVVLTRPITMSSTTSLRVNYAAASGGTLRVALIDPATGDAHPGHSVADCTPLRGDSTSAIVSWGHATHATVHSVAGDGSAQVQVEFSLEGRVDLFSYAAS